MWKANRANSETKSKDGEKHNDVQTVRSEMYDPKDSTNLQSGDLTKAAIEVWPSQVFQTFKLSNFSYFVFPVIHAL